MNFTKESAPETFKLIEDIGYIIKELSDNKLKLLKKKDYEKFKDVVFEREDFHDFIEKYFNVFMILISKEKIPFDMLNKLILMKGMIESGQITQDKADKEIYELMNDKYIYSLYGSKENFENHIKNISNNK